MKWMYVLILSMCLAACQTGPESISDKVLADFGLRERPEGYVSGADRVFEQMDSVGATELKRLNGAARHGEVLFDGEGVRGGYYKQIRVYESYHPLDARAITGGGARDRGYNGIIEYRYRVFNGERKSTRAEAAAAPADIPTDIEGRERYRYTFSTSGVWDGARGERVRR